MTLVSDIIKRAYRETNLIPLVADPSANQSSEALPLLNSLIMSAIGNEVGDELFEVNYGGDNDQSSYISDWVPDNARLVLNLSAAVTLTLDPYPYEGQRLGVVDAGSNLNTYNLTLDGNGRNIEGAATLVLSTDDTYSQWMYRSDTGNWVKIESLDTTDEMPFPIEFDDYFAIMLAIRLNPRYGQELNTQSFEALKRYRSQIRARYRNRNANPQLDLGLWYPDRKWFSNDDFDAGRGWGV